MTNHSDPRHIEADLDQQRAKLASTLDALQDRVSFDALAGDALGLIKANTETYTASIDQAVRSNPIALAIVGVGLAWLIFGGRKHVETPKVNLEAMSNWEDDGGPARPSDEIEPDWTAQSDTLRRRANDSLARLEAEARGATRGLRDVAAERAAILAELATGLRVAVRSGLDGLSVAAQDKIVATREAAYAARLKATDMARTAPKQTGRLIEDHPMVTGAIMLALGAALGAMLPRTAFEDRTFGPERDRLMAKASRLLAEERAAIATIASDLGSEVANSAYDAMHRVSETV